MVQLTFTYHSPQKKITLKLRGLYTYPGIDSFLQDCSRPRIDIFESYRPVKTHLTRYSIVYYVLCIMHRDTI